MDEGEEDRRVEPRREEDRARDQLLNEREEQIRRLHQRVEVLMEDRVTLAHVQHVERQGSKNSETLVRLEHALFGVTGDNGLNSRVRELYNGLAKLQTTLREMREEEFHELKLDLADTRQAVRHWALGIATVLIAAVGLVAAIAHNIH